jgi:hypothetical protein
MTVRLSIRGLLLAVAVLGFPAAASACPFCSAQGQTLSGEVNQADFIVLGTLKNAKRDPNDFTRGTTELHIDKVIKPHEYLAGKSVLTLPRYVPADPAAGEAKFLVFCSVYAGLTDTAATAVVSSLALGNVAGYQLDAYRGEPTRADSKLPEYLKGALAVRQQDTAARLKYFFEYLDSPELVVSSDAYMEFGNTDYKDVRALAEKLPGERVMKWLKDPQTPGSRYGLYGLLIGHCGKKEDASELRKLLDDPARVYSSGLDGMIAGYVMLDPKAGWEYLLDLVKTEKNEFPVRYAGLKVLRFFWEYRPDVVAKDKVLEGMKVLVAQPDLADLPIEDLRKWEQWGLTEFILGFGKKESHQQIPIVRRAVLRFALSAPADNKAAAEYIVSARKADPERVKMIEEMLRDEKAKPAPATTAANGK